MKPLASVKASCDDRVGAGFGDVIAGDRHRVEVADLVVDEVLLDVAHHLQRELGRENAGVLALVFLEDVGLHRAAHRRQRPFLDLLGFVLGRRRGRCRRWNFSTCWSMAVLRNMARIIGAGPLMVIDTEVVGSHRSKPEYSTLTSSSVAIETPELPTLP